MSGTFLKMQNVFNKHEKSKEKRSMTECMDTFTRFYFSQSNQTGYQKVCMLSLDF